MKIQLTLVGIFSILTLAYPPPIVSVYFVFEYMNVILFSWYLCLFYEWCLHNIGHLRIRGNIFYTKHMYHHKIAYPYDKLLQVGPYKSDGSGWIFLPLIILLWTSIYWIVPNKKISTIILIESGGFLIISDYLHTQYHVVNTWLEGFLGDWFIQRRQYHFHHHHHLHRNMSLGGISTIMDRLFGTYWSSADINGNKII